jgi:hypothetical protein
VAKEQSTTSSSSCLPAECPSISTTTKRWKSAGVVHADLGDDDSPRRGRARRRRRDRPGRAAERPVYFSPQLLMISQGVHERSYIARTAALRRLALTFSPATLGLQPIQHRLGDIREAVDRYTWPVSWKSDGLLTRAVDHGCLIRSNRSAQRIVDRRPRDDNPWQLREGQRVSPREFVPRELPGGLRRGAPGRVISVR